MRVRLLFIVIAISINGISLAWGFQDTLVVKQDSNLVAIDSSAVKEKDSLRTVPNESPRIFSDSSASSAAFLEPDSTRRTVPSQKLPDSTAQAEVKSAQTDTLINQPAVVAAPKKPVLNQQKTAPKRETILSFPKSDKKEISATKFKHKEDTLKLHTDSLILSKNSAQADSTSLLSGMKGSDTLDQLKESISFGKVFWSLLFFLVGYLLIKFSVKIMDLFAERSTRMRLSLKRFIPIFRILAWTAVIFIIIQGIISPSWEAIIALGASIGVAVGFAAQDVLKNIFGGITILAEKPFQVGDKIAVGDHYGEVIHIGFRSCRIVTADDSVVTIPNAELTSKMVSNSNSGENNCQVVAEIYLPPDVDTSAVRQIALEAAQVSSLVYLKKPISVLFFHELKENRTFIKMRLKAYVLDIRYEFAFKSEMTEIVLQELYEQGIIKSDRS